MPWSAGTFSRQYGNSGWTNDKNAGTKILASRHDTNDDDLSDGINACITRDGSAKPAADFKPAADATYALGSSVLRWTSAYVSTDYEWVGGTYTVKLNYGTPTANRTLSLPDEAGTLATQAYVSAANGASLVLLSSTAFATGQTSFDFTNLLSGTYDHFLLTYWHVYPSTNGDDIQLIAGSAAPGWFAVGYQWAHNATTSGAANSPAGSAADSKILLLQNGSSTAANGAFGHVWITNDSASAGFSARWQTSVVTAAGSFANFTGSGRNGNNCPSVRLKASAGNINGACALYGVKKA